MEKECLYRTLWCIYLKYQRGVIYKSNIIRLELRSKRVGTRKYITAKDEIERLYFEEELGIKSLAKYLNVSNSVMRQLLFFLNVGIRRGYDVVTNRLRKFRKEKAIRESRLKIGFNDPSIKRKTDGMARGVQGYYFNKSMNKYVWLRSTWEYIYAKWLDRTKQMWDVEVTHYNVDGKTYRPDFFIYDNETVSRIVEIKGYWDSNTNKAKDLDVAILPDVVIIRDVSKYIQNTSTYHKELAEWKKVRITKNGKNQKNNNNQE